MDENTKQIKINQLAKLLLAKLKAKTLDTAFWNLCRYRMMELLEVSGRMEDELPVGMPSWSDLEAWNQIFEAAETEAVLKYLGWRIIPKRKKGPAPLTAKAALLPTNRMWLMLACERLMELTKAPVVRRPQDRSLQKETRRQLRKLLQYYKTYGKVAQALEVDFRVVSRWVCGKANPSLGSRLRMQALLEKIEKQEGEKDSR